MDNDDNAYVTGYTYSANFPTTVDANDLTYGDNGDVFVTKLNTAGSSLKYSTYLRGSGGVVGGEWGSGIALDSSGNAYVTGITDSTNFPTTVGAYSRTYQSSGDVLMRNSPRLSYLLWCLIGLGYSGTPYTCYIWITMETAC